MKGTLLALAILSAGCAASSSPDSAPSEAPQPVATSAASVASKAAPTIPAPGNATVAGARTFSNCSDLRKVYPGGVARVGAVNKGKSLSNRPKIDNKLYAANRSSDRDEDGLACES